MAGEVLRQFYSREAFKNILVITLVYGFQTVIHKDLFRCPCHSAKQYGIGFLVVPPVFLLGVSVVVCRRTWSVVLSCLKKNDCKTKCNYFLSSLIDFFKPFLASATWVTLAFLHGDYYVCIHGGPQHSCVLGERTVNPIDFDQLYAQSFILGSGCLVAMVIFSTGIVFIQRCCPNDIRDLPTFHDLLQHKEQAVVKVFDEKTKEVAREFAEHLVECSFSARDYSESDVDQRFVMAREKVMDIYGHSVVNGCVVDCYSNNMQSMEFNSTSSM